MKSLRQRNRHNAMRLTQRTALDLFITHGFDNVTVGQIADEVGMAASTLYRHFTTKEAIVLWDEHERTMDAAFELELGRQLPLQAIRNVFIAEIANRYDDDLDFQLKRIQFIYRNEQIHAAAYEADMQDAAELAEGLEHYLPKKQKHLAPLMASVVLVALDHALDRWQASDGAEPLDRLISEAFDTLRDLDKLG